MSEDVTYEFTFVLRGTGENYDEALRDAIESFFSDPGDPVEATEVSESFVFPPAVPTPLDEG